MSERISQTPCWILVVFKEKCLFFSEPGILIFHSVKQQQEGEKKKKNVRKETCSFLLNSKKGRHCLIEYFEGSGHLIFAPSAEENSRQYNDSSSCTENRVLMDNNNNTKSETIFCHEYITIQDVLFLLLKEIE